MKFAGIDYSITCPAITIIENDEFKHHYMMDCHNPKSKSGIKNKQHIDAKFLDGLVTAKGLTFYENNTHRYLQIAAWATEICKGCSLVGIEEYAFSRGSAGLVFNLGENGGTLKAELYKAGIPFTTIENGIVKKLATGKGNADKAMMVSGYTKDTGIELSDIPHKNDKSLTPIGDIADSYFLARIAEMEFLND